MGIAQSRVTAQGQVSIPAKIRERFGIAPGNLIEWDESGGDLVIRKAGQYSIQDVRMTLNIKPASPQTDAEIREGIKARVRRKHARP